MKASDQIRQFLNETLAEAPADYMTSKRKAMYSLRARLIALRTCLAIVEEAEFAAEVAPPGD